MGQRVEEGFLGRRYWVLRRLKEVLGVKPGDTRGYGLASSRVLLLWIRVKYLALAVRLAHLLTYCCPTKHDSIRGTDVEVLISQHMNIVLIRVQVVRHAKTVCSSQ